MGVVELESDILLMVYVLVCSPWETGQLHRLASIHRVCYIP